MSKCAVVFAVVLSEQQMFACIRENRCLIEGTVIYYAITSAHTNTHFSRTQVQQHDYELWINNTSDTCTLKHANTHTHTHKRP